MEVNGSVEDVVGDFDKDLEVLRQYPGLENHVRRLIEDISNGQFRIFFFRFYTRLCREHARLYRMNVDRRSIFRAGWEKVRAWSHCVEDLVEIVTDHDSFDAVGPARLTIHSKAVMKLFALHDYLSIFDEGSRGQNVPMLTRMFALLSAINAPDTYTAARSVAISDLGDGGDS